MEGFVNKWVNKWKNKIQNDSMNQKKGWEIKKCNGTGTEAKGNFLRKMRRI